MFAEQDEISKDAGKRMAENYLDGAKEALEGQKQGRVMDAIKKIGKKIKNSDPFKVFLVVLELHPLGRWNSFNINNINSE